MIHHGDCLEILKQGPDNSVDSVVTDPPAGISFMNKAWDDDKGGRDQWVAWLTSVMKETLRVLKPGGHALVWAIPRTSHWTGKALEDAGFEVRDVITHLFGTGFPKSLDISKAIDKAAGAEREVVGTSPNSRDAHVKGGKGFDKAIAEGRTHAGRFSVRTDDYGMLEKNPEHVVIKTTAPSTDAAKQWQGFGTVLKPAAEFWFLVRKPLGEKTVAANVLKWGTGGINIDGCRIGTEDKTHTGRFPANLILDEAGAALLDEQSGVSKSNIRKPKGKQLYTSYSLLKSKTVDNTVRGIADTGGASRFFYVAKASKSDKGVGNTHPTVKSTKLMRYLCRLITPPNGVILDPFMGSGSTGVAALAEGFEFIGIEREAEYVAIATARLSGK